MAKKRSKTKSLLAVAAPLVAGAILILVLAVAPLSVNSIITRHSFAQVSAPITVTLPIVADTFTSVDNPTVNYGGRNTSEIDGSPLKPGYVKVDLTSLTGKNITSAKYRFTVRDGSVSTFSFREVSDNTWGEKTITYQNKPAVGAEFASFVKPVASSSAEVDVTSFVSAKVGQLATFAIDSTGTDGYSYYTKESSTNKPSLVVEYTENLPDPSILPSSDPSALPSSLPSPSILPSPTPGTSVTLGAAGDIACNTTTSTAASCQQMQTSDQIIALNPDLVLELGDMQYGDSKLTTIMKYYHPSWGRFKEKTYPVLGNHESNLTGYFDYWNGIGMADGRAGERGKAYYSFNAGSWHIVALNSNCAAVPGGGCAAGSEQEAWLRADLAAHPSQCTLAMWHHPYYTSGTRGPSSEVRPLVQALYDYGTDVALVGHMHFYERFAPQDPSYNLDLANGIRSFTVGTGGKDYPNLGSNFTFKNLDVRNGKSFGILKMTLDAGSYTWQFQPAPGFTFTDSGSGTCH